ncbi:MAG: mechanosensitive ion channel family protein [Methanomicrobiaceae archaeon]|uniref:Mechanosensitive ion channel MscS domain-containing protein n=1 Tax=hydrocarbon metagenome TaxID=938273 RepID=A0A0W8FH72_9ZZZZ|nr:mechanosensitive ion channel family protein [Methanomicrobiaceae archaeon]MDD5419308.1 mechanosensitive ion channel [Methanomicrobiaceae archaeon]
MATRLRSLLTLVLLAAVTASFWLADMVYPDIALQLFFVSFLAVTVVYALFFVIGGLALRRIAEERARYSFRRIVSILQAAVMAVILLRLWIETDVIFVAYGIIGAGIAIALQDLFKNFVGGILIIVTGAYRIGDRIEVDGTEGDVMDIGILNTTLLEIHAHGVKGDQPTGRITLVPNGSVISSHIYNFTKAHTFTWDEIHIPITYDSDWKKAITLFLEVAGRETAAITARSEHEIENLGERYYLPKKVVEPSIYLTITDNWISLDLRYVAEAKLRRVRRDELTRRLMEAIEQTDGITIASETIDVQVAAKPERRTH